MQTQTARVSVSMGGNDMLCSIHGDIDHHNARVIRMQIDDALYKQRPRKLTLDLSRVEFMDSSGLGLILGRFNKASEIGTEFTLLNPADSVRKILDVAGIARMIKIERKK
ncbi:MAG: anti-sigma factor antagonist [Clostridia bacterium]|nr:anti-sigma factor antagonist [Clostridia bacterium]